MPDQPPRIEVVGGSPTPGEEAAARAAILAIWRDDVAAAVRSAGLSRWRAAARAEATANGIPDLFEAGLTRSAWKLSSRVAGLGLLSARRTGRGDSK